MSSFFSYYDKMSRAFTKEDSGVRWEAPAEAKAYQLLWVGRDANELLRESNDLLELLSWARQRQQGQYLIQSSGGEALAWVSQAA